MLDVIKELIPLLEGAKDGVVWLVAAYFGMMIGKWLLTCGTLLLLARMAAPFFLSLAHGAGVKTTWYDLRAKYGARYTFDSPNFERLLRAAAADGKTANKWDVERAAKALEEAKSK